MLELFQRTVRSKKKIQWKLVLNRDFSAQFLRSSILLAVDQYNHIHFQILNASGIAIGDLEDQKDEAIRAFYDKVQREVLGTDAVLEDLRAHLG